MSDVLHDTTAGAVAAALTRARRQRGSALGAVLTLVVAVARRAVDESVQAAHEVSAEHPCRVLAVVAARAAGAPRLDAELRPDAPGETVVLHLSGHLGEHADSVVLPLLLPDAPVVVWWPGDAPDDLSGSPLGRLATRRVADAVAPRGPAAPVLQLRARHYAPGDTDFAWTRVTTWRTQLAAALDGAGPVSSGEVAAARGNPSAALLAAWLRLRLGVRVTERASRGPGITAVTLTTADGPVSVTRSDGLRATLSQPGQPDRGVALPRRATPDLLAEELRRLDADEPYAETLAAWRRHAQRSPS